MRLNQKFSIAVVAFLFPLTAFANACNNPSFNTTATIIDKDGYSNVRSQPNAKSNVIEKIFENESFHTFSQKGNWWQVCTPSGQVGYLYHDRIKTQSMPQQPVDNIGMQCAQELVYFSAALTDLKQGKNFFQSEDNPVSINWGGRIDHTGSLSYERVLRIVYDLGGFKDGSFDLNNSLVEILKECLISS